MEELCCYNFGSKMNLCLNLCNLHFNSLIITLVLILAGCSSSDMPDVKDKSVLQYTVSMTHPEDHLFHVELIFTGLDGDTTLLQMPEWSPGYYQIMNYASKVENVTAVDNKGNPIKVWKAEGNSWQVVTGGKPVRIDYDVKADRKFVASNFLDSTHAYIVPAATFIYSEEMSSSAVSLKIILNDPSDKIATGLDPVHGKENEFSAKDLDILYDSPLLIGKLEEFSSFHIKGIEHRFISYNSGSFNKEGFIKNLEKVVQAAAEIIGDIPYDKYTFIGIGPGYGGIEHLNNTTVSFNGTFLDDRESMIEMMKFLAHEYFHHYNVKRIRPLELGPFDYSRENRTNLLWVSEGLTVYYEYLIVKRAGLISDDEFIACIESSINAAENDPGRHYQSLIQSSYNTWSDGPFGSRDPKNDTSISCYEKGAVVGLILDLSIRHATLNKRSLDDVMRFLYYRYYKELGRGFTDAEFQQACETIAGCSLSNEFEYVSTTRGPDYQKYLSYAGLKADVVIDPGNGNQNFSISRITEIEQDQLDILQGWLQSFTIPDP